MRVSEREYVESDLLSARRALADVTAPSRQTTPTEAGREYRRQLEDEITRLEARLRDLDGQQ